MNLKKNDKRGLIVAAIVLVIYNVIAFVVPFAHTGVFWISYIFGLIAILVQFPLFYVAFRKENTPKSRFYGFPIAQIGTRYLYIQIIITLFCMFFGKIIPLWIVIVVDMIVLAMAVIGFVATDAMRDEIERQDAELLNRVADMRAIQSKMSVLLDQCKDESITKVVTLFAEEIRYSDPVSSKATAEIEKDLSEIVDSLQQAVIEENTETVEMICKRGMVTLSERNRLCKLDKINTH